MTEPRGFLPVIADHDALPILIAADEIAMISKLVPSESGGKTVIVLRGGLRLMTGTEYGAIVERLALCVGEDKSREGEE